MNRLVRRLVGALLIAVVVYAGAVVYTGFREIAGSLSRFHWSAFALALVLTTGNYALRFAKWQYYLARLDIRGVRVVDSALIFLSGFVLTVTPGKVGEVFKSAVLKKTHEVPAARTAPIVIAERLTDVIAVILLILLGSAGFSGGLHWAGIGCVLVALGLALILWERPIRALLRGIEAQPKLARFAPKLAEAYGSLRLLSSPTTLLWPVALSVVGWGLEGVALYTLLHGFGAPAPLPLAVFFYSTASLAGAVIPVPGGLGVVEAMIQEQLVHLGHVAPGSATASMILVRFATLWWAVLLGFLALGILQRRFPILRAQGEESS